MKAKEVIADLQKRKSRMLIEKDIYAWTAIASGLAAAIGGIYGLHEDAITGIALGGATAVGVSAFQNPNAIAAAYGNGIDAIICTMDLTNQIDDLRDSPSGKATTQTLPPSGKATTRTLRSQLEDAATKLTAFKKQFKPTSYITSRNPTEVAFGYTLLNYNNMVEIAAAELLEFSNFVNSRENNPAKLLDNAVLHIIRKMNKQIESRERDKSKLEPTAITEVAKRFKDKQKNGQRALESLSRNLGIQVVPVMIALSAINPGALIGNKKIAEVMIELNNQVGPFSKAAKILENIDLSKLDFDKCIKELE